MDKAGGRVATACVASFDGGGQILEDGGFSTLLSELDGRRRRRRRHFQRHEGADAGTEARSGGGEKRRSERRDDRAPSSDSFPGAGPGGPRGPGDESDCGGGRCGADPVSSAGRSHGQSGSSTRAHLFLQIQLSSFSSPV